MFNNKFPPSFETKYNILAICCGVWLYPLTLSESKYPQLNPLNVIHASQSLSAGITFPSGVVKSSGKKLRLLMIISGCNSLIRWFISKAFHPSCDSIGSGTSYHNISIFP